LNVIQSANKDLYVKYINEIYQNKGINNIHDYSIEILSDCLSGKRSEIIKAH